MKDMFGSASGGGGLSVKDRMKAFNNNNKMNFDPVHFAVNQNKAEKGEFYYSGCVCVCFGVGKKRFGFVVLSSCVCLCLVIYLDIYGLGGILERGDVFFTLCVLRVLIQQLVHQIRAQSHGAD